MNLHDLFEIKKFGATPAAILFTDRRRINDFARIIKSLPKNSAIIVREYDLDDVEREKFACEIRYLANQQLPFRRPKVIVGKNIRIAKKIGADGVHFSDNDADFSPIALNSLRSKFPRHFKISYVAHTSKSVSRAIISKLDILVVSPIFATMTHYETKPIGLRNLAKISSKKRFLKRRVSGPNLYALGGISSANLKSVRRLGIGGFGSINFLKGG